MEDRFTEEELRVAKSVDLTAVASQLGYTVKRVGKYYTLKEMDSIRIYDKSHWYRWSRQYDKGNNGGSQIDFLRVFCDMDVKEAVFWLLDFAGYRRIPNATEKPKLKYQVTSPKTEERKPFVLPEPSADNSYLYDYLNRDRAIGKAVIDYFVSQGLIYESRHYHNVVFRGNDKEGVTRFASMRGVFDKEGKPFKCDVAGNDKRYGFNVSNEDSTQLIVFEAAIDLMSYVDMFGDYESNKIALGMLRFVEMDIVYNEFGKPFMKHMNGFSYNLSHSGKWVAIAYGSSEVGIDIEEIQTGKEAIADKFFTEEEKSFIHAVTGKERTKRFTQIWTLKESYIKYLGTGLSTSLNSFSVNALDGMITNQNGEIQKGLRLKSYPFGTDYYLSVCSIEEKVTIHEIRLENLIQFIRSKGEKKYGK